MGDGGEDRDGRTWHAALRGAGRLCAWAAGLGLASILLPRYLWYRRARPPADSRSGYLAGDPAAGDRAVGDLAAGDCAAGDCAASDCAASDGPGLAFTHLERGHDRLVIVAHGFMKSKDLPPIARMCGRLAEQADVLAFDFSGHGDSGGEAALDFPAAARQLERVVAYARGRGYVSVGVLGYSLGAGAALIAAADGAPIDAIVAVSSPVAPRKLWVTDVLGLRGFYAERPKAIWRWWAGLMGTHLAAQHRPGVWPIEAASRLNGAPILFVHCGLDVLVRREQTEALYAAAPRPKAYLYAPYALHASPAAGAAQVLGWLNRHLPSREAGQRRAAAPVQASNSLEEMRRCTTR